MRRALVIALIALASPAYADDGFCLYEMGVNTRAFAAVAGTDVAVRSTNPPDAALAKSTAQTVSFRFTGRTRYGTYVGAEAEAGVLEAPGSNLAGVYGLAGVRGDTRLFTFRAELASGFRKVRYDLDDTDATRLLLEPRARADIWLSPRFTLGGAIGATFGDRSVWLAGLYLGVHSSDFDGR